jgi:ATP-dependent Clp protease protease subunit
MPRSVAYVRFQGRISPESAASLLAIMTNLANQDVRRVVLVLTTRGGEIPAGLRLYKGLLAVPFHLVTHAIGTVQSMGIAVYLAGDERITDPLATFLLHPSHYRCDRGEVIDLPELRQIVKRLTARDRRERSILVDRTSLTSEQAKALVEGYANLDAKEAVDAGIAHKKRKFAVVPADAPVYGLGPYPYPDGSLLAPPPGAPVVRQ